MGFGRKGIAGADAPSAAVYPQSKRRSRPKPDRPTNAREVIGTPSKRPKSNRIFGSALFFVAALLIGGGGLWAHRSMHFYYEEGIPVAAEITGSRMVTPTGNSRRYRKLTLSARHPRFGMVELELRKPSKPAPLPSGAPSNDERIALLLHPDDPTAGRIPSVEGPTSPIWVTTIMALVFAAMAGLNLVSERRIIGSRKTRLRRD